MNNDGFTIHTKRWSGAVWAVVGMVLLYLAIDLRFLHRIPGAAAEASDSWIVFFILVLMGLGILYPAIRAVIKPRLLIAVGTECVTVSAAGDRSEWNPTTRRMEAVIRYGDTRSIPWRLIDRIELGVIESYAEESAGGAVIERTESSKTSIGGTTIRKSRQRPALRLLFSREISMDLISVGKIIVARTGDALHEIDAEDSDRLSPQKLEDRMKSELLVDARLLPGKLETVVDRLRKFKSQSG